MKLFYVEISDTQIITGKIVKKHDTLSLEDQQKTPLEERTSINGILYKPTELMSKISRTLIINKHKHLHTICCIPALKNVPKLKLPCAVLQYALSISNTGCIIRQIVTTQFFTQNQTCLKKNLILQENLLNFIENPSSKNPLPWLVITLMLLLCLTASLFITQSHIHSHNKNLQNNILITQQTIKALTQKDKHKQEFKKAIESTKKVLMKIDYIKEHAHNPYPIYNDISQSIPAPVWLTSIKILKEKNSRTLGLDGMSSSMHTVTKFIQNLTQSSHIHNIELLNVIKVKKSSQDKKLSKHKRLYAFKLVGKLTDKTN